MNVIIGTYRLLAARYLLFVTAGGRLVLHDASYRCALLSGYPPRFTIHEPLQSKLCKPPERDLLCASPLYQCQPAVGRNPGSHTSEELNAPSWQSWNSQLTRLVAVMLAILRYPEMICGGKYRASAEIRSPAGRELLDERSARGRWERSKNVGGRGFHKDARLGPDGTKGRREVNQEQGFQHTRSEADWLVTPLAPGAGAHKVRFFAPEYLACTL